MAWLLRVRAESRADRGAAFDLMGRDEIAVCLCRAVERDRVELWLLSDGSLVTYPRGMNSGTSRSPPSPRSSSWCIPPRDASLRDPSPRAPRGRSRVPPASA